MRVLRLGMRGSDVMKIQAVLAKLGYSPGTIDGVHNRLSCSFSRIMD
jgi:g-D-glutamyl-meso-diaminopimelate peptidase